MTPLRRAALAMVPLSEDYITEMYKVRDIKDYPRGSAITAVTAICESHERLRAEVEGAEVIITDYEAEVAKLKAALKGLIQYAGDAETQNSDEWMRMLADSLNAATLALNEPTVYVWNKSNADGAMWFTTRSIP